MPRVCYMCPMLLSLLLYAACHTPSPAETGTPEGDCPVAEASFSGVEASVTGVSTVLRVQYSTVEAVAGFVRFEVDGVTTETSMETEVSTVHEALLLGISADTDVSFQAGFVQDEAHT